MFGFGDILGIGGSLLGGLFGDEDEGAAPAQSVSGFAALPYDVQQAYLQKFVPDSLWLYKNDNNPYEGQVMNSLGGGITSFKNELPQYMNPYQSAVTNDVFSRMQQEGDIAKSRALGQTAVRGGVGAFGSSALGTQLAGIDNYQLDRQREYLNQSKMDNYNQAIDLRNMLLSGQEHAATIPYNKVNRLGSLLGMVPGSSTQTGAIAGSPNWASKLSGGMISLSSLLG